MITDSVLMEGTSAKLTDLQYQQMELMEGLMEEWSPFHLSKTPSGNTVSVDRCIGQIIFRDGKCLNVVPDLPNVKRNISPSQMLIEMMYSVFGMETRNNNYENLFEFCIRVFSDTINRLIMKGLRSKYHSVEGNEKSFKGRIMFNEHIRQNFIHKERIYVEYETYSQNRPENRIIKSTIEVLLRNSLDSRNRKNLKTLLMSLEEIPSSEDVDRDFSRCVMDRNMVDYAAPMMWCNIFLKGMGLAGSANGTFPYALLVKTDVLFGAYVARMSSRTRTDGAFLTKYGAEVKTEGGANGASVIIIDLNWNFYNRDKDVTITDAEMMFMSAPGYRVIPHAVRGDRLRAMAGSYLSDAIV